MTTEQKTTHTPGPWNASCAACPPGEWNVYAKDNGPHAEVGELCVVASYLTEGNARLIAAAPVLLIALRSVAEWATRTGAMESGDDVAVAELVSAAIAKAEGGEA